MVWSANIEVLLLYVISVPIFSILLSISASVAIRSYKKEIISKFKVQGNQKIQDSWYYALDSHVFPKQAMSSLSNS